MRFAFKAGRLVWPGLVILSAFITGCGSSDAPEPAPQVRTLSSDPSRVTGGNVLIEVTLTGSTKDGKVKVTSGAKDFSDSFKPTSSTGRYLGLIEGLPEGTSTFEIQAVSNSGGSSATSSLKLVNHPSSGPVFAGAKETPYICTVSENGMGQALDANCSAKTEVSYRYWASSGAFKTLDPDSPLPSDLTTTQTSDGKTVNFIVRLERGTLNRGIYQIAFLHQPGTALPNPWTNTADWNRRLRYNFGGGCGGGHTQGVFETTAGGVTYSLATVLDKPALARGYAVATSSLNVGQVNCNSVVSAETLAIVKEYFIKRFGQPVWTVGKGGSGGAVQQFEIAQGYPGLLDGISPDSSFPTMMEAATMFSDCKLLRTYMASGDAAGWTDEQKRAVSGYATWTTCNGLGVGLGNSMVNASSCDPRLPAGLAFNAVSNPAGVRCALADVFSNVYGLDPATQVARRPLDNVGVQYGLVALKSGAISVDQFLDLNEKLGGFDLNGAVQRQRHVGNTQALSTAYDTGRVLVGVNLDAVPMISSRTYNDKAGDLHDRTRDFQIRAKLDDRFGNHDNHVLLIAAPGSPSGSAEMVNTQIIEMEKWLDGIAADLSADGLAQKVKRHKPVTAQDTCWRPDGSKVTEPASFESTGICNSLYKPYLDPRSAAGAPLAETALKCQRKPVDVSTYGVPFSADQATRLSAVFPEGVCDYSKPGVEQKAPTRFWASF
ncbi:DUF6351 family protein [Ottowia thiooxydans]|uniref:DUF6351 family protein n=1 Tax=Ottowia thiooxydans TaxID=219182 RepID=UPI000429038B|nr:DUF6351 family protein [Ottowia thiooxydans]